MITGKEMQIKRQSKPLKCIFILPFLCSINHASSLHTISVRYFPLQVGKCKELVPKKLQVSTARSSPKIYSRRVSQAEIHPSRS